jgi:CBS domain-containing protein
LSTSLRKIMSTNVETVTLKDNVYECAMKMKEHNIGVIPVVDEHQHCIGVVTDRDIVIRGIAEKREGSAAVREVMSTRLITGTPEMTVDDAANLMAREQIRRLPITEQGRLVGIVAMADMATMRIHVDEAGYALSQISVPSGQHTQGLQ